MGESVYGRIQQPDEPVVIKGLNPFYGCSQYLNENHNGFLQACKTNNGDIFTLRLANNSYMTFIMDSKAMKAALYDKNAGFFQMSPKTWGRFGIKEITTSIARIKVLSGTLQEYIRFSQSVKTLLTKLQETIKIEFNDKIKRKTWIFPNLRLYEWIGHLMFRIECGVFYGQSFANDEELKNVYKQFAKSVPLRFAGNSTDSNEDALNVLLTKMKTLIDYYYENNNDFEEKSDYKYNEDRNNIPHIMKAAHEICSKLDASSTDECGILVAMLWATIANSTNGIFWTLINILQNKECKEKILQEVNNFDVMNIECTDLKKLRKSLPLLDSVICEMFRYYGMSHLYRVAKQDIFVNVQKK
eukprot:118986_1